MKYILSLLTVLFCLVGSVAAQGVPAFFYPSNGAYVNIVGDSLIYYERTDGTDSIIVVFSQNGIYFRVHVADSALMTIQAVKLLVEDSLNEYSLTSAISSTYETITNVAKIGDDTATWKAVAAQAAADSGKWRVPEAAALTNLTTTAPLYKVSAGVVACSTATATLRGVAKFNTDNFGVASGDVTIKSGGVNSDEVLNNTLDTADMAHAPLGKFVRDSAASAIGDTATVLRTYSDTSQSTIKNDLFLYGDLSQVNHKVEFDLSNIWSQRPSPFFIDSIWWKAGDDYHWPVSSADSTNIRDTLDYIVFPTTFTSTLGLGDSLSLMDSGCVVHLSGQYIPQGWNGAPVREVPAVIRPYA